MEWGGGGSKVIHPILPLSGTPLFTFKFRILFFICGLQYTFLPLNFQKNDSCYFNQQTYEPLTFGSKRVANSVIKSKNVISG